MPKSLTSFYRRNLPHWQVEGASYFITFIVQGALPKAIVEIYKEEKRKLLEQAAKAYEKQINHDLIFTNSFMKIEKYLHAASGKDVHLLTSEEVQRIIIDSLLWFAKRGDIRLIAVCVMSNHVHLVIDQVKLPVEDLMKRHKSFTATMINRVLGRTGNTLWHQESFDHMPRTQAKVLQKTTYTINNAVAAGLVQFPADHTGTWWNEDVVVVDGTAVSWRVGADLPVGLKDIGR